MILLLDVGNSRIKYGFDLKQAAKVADSFQALQRQWATLDENVSPTQIIASNVRGPKIELQIESLAKQYLGVEIDWQHTSARACGVVNAYPEPSQLGVDRWLAMIAANARYPSSACIVVDAGSAITVDLLDAQGQHQGGVILPGKAMMLQSMQNAAQLFPKDEKMDHSVNACEKSTQAGISSGIHFSIMGGVQSVIEQQASSINVKINDISILMTGGDASMFQFNLRHMVEVPNLVLEGLSLMAKPAS